MIDNENAVITRPAATTGVVAVEQQRAMAEVQAAVMVARAQPRNVIAAMDGILQDCMRPGLAEVAVYEYGRGGSAVVGPSIRLAEAIARRYGNIECGVKELSRHDGYSECAAYAIDLENNFRDVKTFQVRHWRDTKSGGYKLTDERDIYELTANMGARRKRACILAIIPGDIVEAAVKQCEETLRAKADTSPEGVAKMLEAFEPWGVTREHVEKRIQRKLDAITAAQMVSLKKVFASLRDGMAKPGDFFDMAAPQAADEPTPPPAAVDRATELAKRLRAARETAQETAGAAAKPAEAPAPTRGRKAAPKAQETPVPPVPPATDEWTDIETGEVNTGPTYAQVMAQVESAETSDDLDVAADLARAIGNATHRNEVLLRIAQRKLDLAGGGE